MANNSLKALRSMGKFISDKRRTSALKKLNSHSWNQHKGLVLPECRACQELTAQAKKELANGQ
jgi:hypothetical protein